MGSPCSTSIACVECHRTGMGSPCSTSGRCVSSAIGQVWAHSLAFRMVAISSVSENIY